MILLSFNVAWKNKYSLRKKIPTLINLVFFLFFLGWYIGFLMLYGCFKVKMRWKWIFTGKKIMARFSTRQWWLNCDSARDAFWVGRQYIACIIIILKSFASYSFFFKKIKGPYKWAWAKRLACLGLFKAHLC